MGRFCIFLTLLTSSFPQVLSTWDFGPHYVADVPVVHGEHLLGVPGTWGHDGSLLSVWLMDGLESVTQALHTYRSNSSKIYHLTLVWMAIITKSTNNKFWRQCGEKGTLLHCWWECKLVQPLWRTVWRFPNTLEIELPYDSAIPLLDIHIEETRIERDMCTSMFIATLFTTARTWKQPRCPSADEWIRKLWYIYRMEYYSATKWMCLNQF